MEPAAPARLVDGLLPHLRVLEERPLFPFALYLCLGIASCTALPLWLPAGLLTTAALAAIMILLHRKKHSILFPAMLLAFAAGYTLAAAAIPRWASDPWEPAGRASLTGRIVEAGKTSGGYDDYVLDDVTIGGAAVQGKVVLTVLRANRSGLPGDRLAANAEIERPQPSLHYGGFNARGWYMRRGIRFEGFAPVADVTIDERRAPGLPERARQYARDTLYRYLSPDSAALVNALLSGDTSGIRWETRRDFTDLGVAHLLAVSGLNITLTAGAAWLLCRKLRLPWPVSLAISFAVMASYVTFAGLMPSVLRAAAMWLVGMGALVFARRYDPLSSLAAAAILILVANPLDLFDAGFQLSFAATAAMFLWLAPLLRHMPDRKWMQSFAGAVGVTICVTLAALPVILGYFHSVSLLSPFANLVLVPTSFVMQLMGMALLFVGFLPDVTALLGGLLDGYATIYLQNVRMLSWSASTLPAATAPVWLSAVFLALVLLASPSIARFRAARRGRVAVLVALAVVGAVMLSPASAALTWRSDAVVVAEQGASLSVYWQVNGRSYAACAGGWSQLGRYLASRGIPRLEGLYVLSAEPPPGEELFDAPNRLPVSRLYVPAGWLEDPEAQAFLSRAVVLGMEPASAAGGPFAYAEATGRPAMLLIPTGGGTIAFLPAVTEAGIAASIEGLRSANAVLLGARPGKGEALLAGLPLKALVLPGTIAQAGYPRYNIVDAGSIEIESRGGALALIPWIGGWADGLQGNFR